MGALSIWKYGSMCIYSYDLRYIYIYGISIYIYIYLSYIYNTYIICIHIYIYVIHIHACVWAVIIKPSNIFQSSFCRARYESLSGLQMGKWLQSGDVDWCHGFTMDHVTHLDICSPSGEYPYFHVGFINHIYIYIYRYIYIYNYL